MKLVVLCVFIASLQLASCQWRMSWRHRITNVACRMTHHRAVVDSRGRVTDCVIQCGQNYEEKYSWKYGHYCSKLPGGCAVRNCQKCLAGYLQLIQKYRANKCVRKCPRESVQKQGKCLELPTGCKDIECSGCRNGYFYNPKRSYFGTKCIRRCPTGYTENTTNNTCDRAVPKEGCAGYYCYRCVKGYYKFIKDFRNTCVKSCPQGHGPMHGSCRKIPDGCKDANCTACVDSYFHYEKAIYFQKCRSTCPLGYFANSTINTCVVCEADHCGECNIKVDYCEQCRRPNALLVKLYPNGSYYTNCYYRCPAGYRKIYDVGRTMWLCDEIEQPKPKVVKPEGCEDMSCLQCKKGYYRLFISSVGSKCVLQCPSGYFTSATECLACSEPRCDVCSKNPVQCEVCKDGYISDPQSANGTVKCLADCPTGSIAVTIKGSVICEKVPEPACAITNCERCSSHQVYSLHAGCIECKAGYFLKRNIFRDDCVSVCPNGLYHGVKPGTEIDACLNCGVPFCKSCVSRKKCIECHEPFVFDPETLRCSLCVGNTIYNRNTKSCKSPNGL